MDELQKHEINLIKNLSVGKNFHDHLNFTGLACQLEKNNDNYRFLSIDKWLKIVSGTHRGLFYSTGLGPVTLFARTKYEQSKTATDFYVYTL